MVHICLDLPDDDRALIGRAIAWFGKRASNDLRFDLKTAHAQTLGTLDMTSDGLVATANALPADWDEAVFMLAYASLYAAHATRVPSMHRADLARLLQMLDTAADFAAIAGIEKD